MGGAAVWLAAWLSMLAQPALQDAIYIVDFAPRADPDVAARELCLRVRCTVVRVYRYLPGAAVSGTAAGVLERQAQVMNVTADQPVRLAAGYRLIGAPSHAPLAVVGGGLDAARLVLERERMFLAGAPSPGSAAQTTALVAGLAERIPSRVFWSFAVVGDEGGRLSDVLAALDELVSLRFALAAVYAPLALEGAPPARLCRTIDEVLRRGLLVVTDLDAGCPSAPVR